MCEDFTNLSKSKFKTILRAYGQYPSDRRHVYWRLALCLPYNKYAFNVLHMKGLHPAFKAMHKDYKFVEESLRYNLIRLCSNLAHWMPFFPHIKYFPVSLIRFQTVFKYCPVSSFEAVATILENYCQHWFDDFPFAPKQICLFIENTVARKDPVLTEHLRECDLSPAIIGWAQLETLFTEVLDETSWFILWDHILIEHPKYLLMVAVAFIITSRRVLMNVTEKSDIHKLRQPIKINIHQMIDIAYKLLKTEPCDIKISPFIPMNKQNFYECSRIYHPMEFEEFEDINLEYVRKTESKIVEDALTSKALPFTLNKPLADIIAGNDDYSLRRKKLCLLERSLQISDCFVHQRGPKKKKLYQEMSIP